MNKTKEYEVGEILTCREYTKLKVGTFNVNCEYEIIEVTDTTITILDMIFEEKYKLPLKTVRNNFIYNYCSTCHSTQGETLEDNITIYDWKFYFTSREWLWVAVTRTTSLDNVYFYDYVEPELNHD